MGSESNSSPPSSRFYRPSWDMWTFTNAPGIDLLLIGPYTTVEQVYVILFGAQERGKEGIYSLRRCAFGEDSLPVETIITFECEEDAIRYGCYLEATMEHRPQVACIHVQDLCHFCKEHGYQCRMEPLGSLLIPPEFNVTDTDWERSERLRSGRWSVLTSEPGTAYDGSPAGPAPLARYAGLRGSELEQVRARLEKLLADGAAARKEEEDWESGFGGV